MPHHLMWLKTDESGGARIIIKSGQKKFATHL